ncbi:MAG TPA: septal ring lytic transglycosylase RlpA family protein [Mariprofundaceae bacterium]|nr:septal ring lytic transglycosylase RlpA family protein [Mariprofundaceae bacterium]
MRRVLKPGLALLALAALLAGCGGKHVGAEGGKLPDGSGGYYKTGSPYEVSGRWYTPLKSAAGYDETGIASWYGRDFHGKSTANGERYDMHAMSAAHKTLPLPTIVRVTNLENGRSVIVRVNDRGPFVKNRLIDLSYAAANALGFADDGTARVRVQTLDVNTPALPLTAQQAPAAPAIPPASPTVAPAVPAPSPAPAIVGTAYADEAPKPAGKGGIYIQLGAFSSRESAERIRQNLQAQYPNTFIQSLTDGSRILFRVRIGPLESMHRIEETMLSLQGHGYTDAIVVIE